MAEMLTLRVPCCWYYAGAWTLCVDAQPFLAAQTPKALRAETYADTGFKNRPDMKRVVRVLDGAAGLHSRKFKICELFCRVSTASCSELF